VRKVATDSGCSLPLTGIVHDSLSRRQCLAMCLQQPGCGGFNFRSTGSKQPGQCALVAPDPLQGVAHELPAEDPEKGEWRYYAVDM
jgi:hypothetical protein